MAAEGAKKAEVEAALAAAKDVPAEKAVVPAPQPPPPADDSKALVVAEKVVDKPPVQKNTHRNSNDRDIALANVETEKRNSLIKAWEENEKAKAENKAAKKLSAILSWENTKKAVVEAQLKKKEEELEKKKAQYTEKMKNKKAIIHKEAEEKRAMVMAQRGEEVLKAEEMAAKYRATGLAPKKFLGCFGA
uniref:Remorin C-terminal domain-containing protein n=1 Tax=Arundo donax TaxID=35708 RepID=A0A0A9GEW5_ARUDO